MMKKIVLTVLLVSLFLIPNPVEPGDEGLEEFVPSEKVSADSSISFPVDI